MNEGNRVPPVEQPEEPEGAARLTPAARPDDAARSADGIGGGDRIESADRSGGGDRTESGRVVVPEATGADGDFELAKPAPVPPTATDGQAAAPAGETAVPSGETGVPAVEAAAVPVEERTESAGETAVVASGERPKPLHDPDPYSTPPYGEPGPWAPAPPVQHPAVTPTHGTAVPAPAAHAPAPAPHVPAPAPAPTAPVPAPTAQVPDPVTPVPAAAPAPVASPAPAPVSAPLSGDADAQGADPWGRYDPWAAGSAQERTLAPGPLQQTGAAVLTHEQRNRRGKRLLLVWTLVVALVAAGIGGAVGAYVEREGLGDDVRLPQAGSVPVGRAPDSVAGIAARALPSVVTLHVRGTDAAGTGTGFVLDERGHILTNNHVVEPAGSGGEISVTFSSGETVGAKVVGRDSGYDLAVVQVHGVRGLTPLPLGNSDDVRVGDPVVAIGAPFDLANTVTSGIISAKERPITAGGEKSDGSDVSYVDALQTDAPINPGNSGGPLLDSRAEVIGINSAIRSAGSGSGSAGGGQAGSIGLGFAIPVNQAKRVAEELINEGRATHPVIGVTLDMGYTGDGARIDDKSANGGPAVTRGGPGERAGLRAGDVVRGVGGERVHTGEELIVKIRAHRPGDRLRLRVQRDGTEREVSLVLGASEQN
ncbi:S1C family serine protease [Streptomyces echinatus]|uniref:Putative serine protease PepD n=1 Tax=Streptomyces echinatus TaxID=67293 RepID=A0A7W9UT24_9ACTN|nr:trypsin-like peptidase domain-containing protein [Streptomyces echinatus]MBB5929159.1 putative serine protease PepD [Streptomyces echinatus]